MITIINFNIQPISYLIQVKLILFVVE